MKSSSPSSEFAKKTKSVAPFPEKSNGVTRLSSNGTPYVTAVWNVPSPLPFRRENDLLSDEKMTISRFPSASTSTSSIPLGFGRLVWMTSYPKDRFPLFRMTTKLFWSSAATKSNRPLLFTSPTDRYRAFNAAPQQGPIWAVLEPGKVKSPCP